MSCRKDVKTLACCKWYFQSVEISLIWKYTGDETGEEGYCKNGNLHAISPKLFDDLWRGPAKG